MRVLLVALACAALPATASAQSPARAQVVIGAAPGRAASALLLMRIAVPIGDPERAGRVEDLRRLIRGYAAARPGLVLAGVSDVASGEIEPAREELLRAAQRRGASEVVILSVDDYRGCGSLSLPVPIIATYGRAALRLERYAAPSGRVVHAAAAIRHVGGVFARLDETERSAVFGTTLDALWVGVPPDDPAASAGFQRTCVRSRP